MPSSNDRLAEARDAALKALADYTGISDPMKPWWNLNMPKAVDIMLPAICDALDAAGVADANRMTPPEAASGEQSDRTITMPVRVFWTFMAMAAALGTLVTLTVQEWF